MGGYVGWESQNISNFFTPTNAWMETPGKFPTAIAAFSSLPKWIFHDMCLWSRETCHEDLKFDFEKVVGGLNPSEKYEFVSWDDIPNWMESHKIHVPNHQPEKFCRQILRGLRGSCCAAANYCPGTCFHLSQSQKKIPAVNGIPAPYWDLHIPLMTSSPKQSQNYSHVDTFENLFAAK